MRQQAIVLMIVALLTIAAGARAATINYAPGSGGNSTNIYGKVPLSKLGSVAIPRGKVRMRGSQIEVTIVPEWMFDPTVVLSGVMLNSRTTVEDGQTYIRALAYFQDGEWLKYVNQQKFPDELVTASGVVVGRIIRLNDAQELEVEQAAGVKVSIPVSTVQDIHSPRAYRVVVALMAATPIGQGTTFQADVKSLTLRPTSRAFGMVALKRDLSRQGDGDLTTGKLVLIGTALSVAELGTQVPVLVFPLRNPGLFTQGFYKQLNTLLGPSLPSQAPLTPFVNPIPPP